MKMFKGINQPGLICIFDADLEHPLKLWNKKIRDGHIKRKATDEIKGLLLELNSKLPLSNYINCPIKSYQTLGILYPYFNMIVRLQTSTFFAFDIQVLDDKNIRRRLRMSTVQTFVDIHPFMCKLPMTVVPGWNRILIPIHQFLKDIYGTSYEQTLRVAVYSNCQLKKIYFSDKEYPEEDTPPEFHLEDPDPAEKYRLNYTALITQKRKNSRLISNDASSKIDDFFDLGGTVKYFHRVNKHKPNQTNKAAIGGNGSQNLADKKPICALLLSHQNKPLKLWNKKIRGGHINQLLDKDLNTFVLEIYSMKSPRTYITCPADSKKVLGIRAPFLHFTIKYMERPILVDVLIRDCKNVKRRFRALTKQDGTQLKPYSCTMNLKLEKGWNNVTVPLKEYTQRAYGTRYLETLRVQMHASCRVHRVYFSHKNLPEELSAIS